MPFETRTSAPVHFKALVLPLDQRNLAGAETVMAVEVHTPTTFPPSSRTVAPGAGTPAAGDFLANGRSGKRTLDATQRHLEHDLVAQVTRSTRPRGGQ